MKKNNTLFIMTLLLIITFMVTAAAEIGDTSGTYIYRVPVSGVSSGTYYIYGVKSPSSYVGDKTIPTTIWHTTVAGIGEMAFSNCDELTSISIPDTVKSIGEGAFSGCLKLKKITYSGTSYITDDGILYDSNKTKLKCYPAGIENDSFIIPDSVTKIESYAFWQCINLNKVIIPNSVKSIGENAFLRCDNLTLYGYTDSVAETYATDNGIPFVPLDSIVYHSTSLTLDGSLGMKIYFEYNGDIIDTNTMTFTAKLSNSDINTEEEREFSITLENDGKTAYSVVYIAPKDIDNITVSSVVKAKTLDGKDIWSSDIPNITVKAYIDTLKDLAESDVVCAKALPLVEALEVYCDYADKYFDDSFTIVEEIYLDEIDESKIIALASPTRIPDKTLGNIVFYSTSLILEDKVTVRHYFKVTEEINLDDYVVSGASGIKYAENNDAYVYVDVENISADKLSEQKTVTITYKGDEMTVTFSPLNYVGLTYEHKDVKLRNLAKALYRYSVEADLYINGTPIQPEENETEAKEW